MAGPFDFASEEMTLSERLPLGLGSPGLEGWWPDLVGIGGGALLEMGAVRWASAPGSTKAQRKSLSKSLKDIYKRGGPFGGGKGVLDAQARRMHRASRGMPPNKKGPRWRSRTRSTSRALWRHEYGPPTPAQHYFDKGQRAKVNPSTASKVSWQRSIGKSKIQARMFRAGSIIKGIGITAAAVQTAAGLIDLGEFAGEAAVDWRPRRMEAPKGNFGGPTMDPGGARTQRQRVLHAIHESQLSTRAAIGGEAAFMHG